MQEVVSEASKDVEETRLVQMADFLRARAPKLGPNVAPNGPLKLAASNLMSIWRTHKQRLEAESYIAKRIEIENGGEAGEGGADKEIVLVTELDFTKRTFRICGAKVAGRIEATLRNLQRLMELHLNSGPAELEPYAGAFASANELAEDASAMTTLRDVCSLAYALQIAASHMPGWNGFVGTRQLPIAEDTDVTELLDELFGSPPLSSSAPASSPKSRRKKGTPSKRSQSRSKSTERKRVEGTGKEAGVDKVGNSKPRQGAPAENVAKPARGRSRRPAEGSEANDAEPKGEGSRRSTKATNKKQEKSPSSTRKTKGLKRKAK